MWSSIPPEQVAVCLLFFGFAREPIKPQRKTRERTVKSKSKNETEVHVEMTIGKDVQGQGQGSPGG